MTQQDPGAISAAWDRVAAGYDERVTPWNMALAEQVLDRVGLRSGMRFLDVAAGSGALSIPAARTGAEVLATDISPAMVDRLEARARAEGLSTLQARVMDGHRLELADGSFDVCGSQFGIMLFPDLPRGLRELARVTRPGGRALIVAFGPLPKMEFLRLFVGALQKAVPGFAGPPMDPPPLPFQLADPEKLKRALTASGFRDADVEHANHRLEFESAEEMWGFVTASNPIGAAMVANLSAEQEEAARRELGAVLRERAGGSGPAVLSGELNIAVATK